MILRPVALPEVPGALFLSALPGGAAPLDDFLAAAKAERIGHVLCLVGAAEIAAKSPDYDALLAADAGDRPWSWQGHPIEDFGTPDDAAAFAACIAALAARLRAGDRVVLHCGAGIGRTGTAALCLLAALGLHGAEAEGRVRSAGSHPETPEQRAFAASFSAGGCASARAGSARP